MATTTQIVSLDIYLRSSYEPDAEYVDRGIVFEMNEIKELLD